MGASNSDAIRQTSEAQTPGLEGSTPSCSTNSKPNCGGCQEMDIARERIRELEQEVRHLRLGLHGISDMLLQTL